MDIRQTKEYGEYMQSRGWVVEKTGGINVFIKKLPLLPISVMKIQRFEQELKRPEIERLKKKYKVFMSVFEPLDGGEGYEGWGYGKSKSPYLPTKTVVVDLRKSEEQIWKEIKKDARGLIKKNDGLEIKKIDRGEIRIFWDQWKKWGKGYIPGLESLEKLVRAFGSKSFVLCGGIGDELVCGMVILLSSDTAFYYYAWTSEKGRKMGGQYMLVWEGIKRAKKGKLKYWDFEGIEDERVPRKSWQGFTLFKKKFGGDEKKFPGSYQKWF